LYLFRVPARLPQWLAESGSLLSTWLSFLVGRHFDANGSTSNLRVGRTIEAFQFRLVGRRGLHLPPDPHKYRKRN